MSAKKKGPGGRPTGYTEELGDLICEGLAIGKSLIKVCEEDGMPAPRTVYGWLRLHPEFLRNYKNSKEDQADAMVEEMLEIADDDEKDVQRSRLMVDTRKWAASKFKTKVYGDRRTVELEGSLGLTDMSGDELDRKIQQLEQAINQSERI